MVRVAVLRRISQALFFALLVFTSYIIVVQIDTSLLPFIEANPDVPRPDWYNPPAQYVQVLDTYGPAKTCRFVGGESRLFRACFLHFISEGIVWATPLTLMIPHILVFVGLAFVFGRAFCGWMCPLGFLSEAMGLVRKRLGIRRREFSQRTLSIMAKFRYGFLSFIIIASLAIAIPAIGLTFLQAEFSIIGCQTCPARIIFPLFSGNAPGYYSFGTVLYAAFAVVGLSFLALFAASFFFNRPFCRICPSGTILSLFNVGSLLSKEKDVRRCTGCGICARVCPMDNKNVYKERMRRKIDSASCVRCLSCIEHCPEKGCLKLKLAGKEIMSSGKRVGRLPREKVKKRKRQYN